MEPVLDSKPWYASQAVWGGVGAIGAGLGGAYYAYFVLHDINSAGAGLLAAFGGMQAIIGRFRATQPIAKSVLPPPPPPTVSVK